MIVREGSDREHLWTGERVMAYVKPEKISQKKSPKIEFKFFVSPFFLLIFISLLSLRYEQCIVQHIATLDPFSFAVCCGKYIA